MRWLALAGTLAWGGSTPAYARAPVDEKRLLEQLDDGKPAISEDQRTVALPMRSWANGCGENVEVELAPIGKVAGERFLTRSGGKCPQLAPDAAKVGRAALEQRLVEGGFRALEVQGADTDRELEVDELVVHVDQTATSYDVRVERDGTLVGAGSAARPDGAFSRFDVAATYGAPAVLYLQVHTERTDKITHQRTEVLEQWTAIALTAPVPVPAIEVRGGMIVDRHGDPTAALAKLRGKRAAACQRGGVTPLPPYVIVRCDERFVVFGVKGRVLIDEKIGAKVTLALDVWQTAVGELGCAEVETFGAGGGDRVRCFDARGRKVLERADKKRISVTFFHGKPPYARVAMYPGGALRLRWNGKLFK